MTRPVRVRDGNVLEVLRPDGVVIAEVRPGYEDALGPVIHIYRVGIHDSTERLLTLPIPTVSELVRKLPIVVAASRRLQVRAKNPAK
jgi:hypothetical protein